MTDGLDYFRNINKELKKLDTIIKTEIKIDEDKLVEKVTEKMARRISGITTESRGAF